MFEIIDSCTFAAKAISNTMWAVFELIHKSFKDRGEIYIEGKKYLVVDLLLDLTPAEMLPALDNYVSYGADTLKENPALLDAVFDIIRTVLPYLLSIGCMGLTIYFRSSPMSACRLWIAYADASSPRLCSLIFGVMPINIFLGLLKLR